MALRRKTPADRLFYAILGLSLALIAVIYCAVNQPASHLRFEVKERQKISVFDGQRLILWDVDSVAISSVGGENRILLNANDFIEDPHFVATYSEMQQFFIKQSQIYQLMSQHQQIFLQSGDHSSSTPYPVNIQPKRTLRDLPVTLQMLSAILCMVWQWRANRHDPRAKVALRWFALWILVSSGAFVFLVQSTQLLDIQLNMSQGYSFGFFLFVTIGIAIGLKRYQLFSLDRWAFGILYWLAGAILLVLLDAFLVMMLSPLMSLSLAILICGLVWLPVRGWLQARLLQRKKLSDSELFERILQVSFAVNEQERQLQWKALLNDLFQPLNLEISEQRNHSQIEDNGLVLYTPQVAGLAAMRLSYPQ